MRIRSTLDLGKLIRIYRRHAGLTQAQLAERLCTTQGWVSEVERGKARAEVGMVLSALAALDVSIDIPVPGVAPASAPPHPALADYPDIDAIVDAHCGPQRQD